MGLFGNAKEPKAPDYLCVCKHPISMHALDDATMRYGPCNSEKKEHDEERGIHFRPCACLRYTGPVPPEDYLRLARGKVES